MHTTKNSLPLKTRESMVRLLNDRLADALETAIAAGVRAVIQPGGSRNDEAAVALCDAKGVAMVLAGHRHFRH